MIKTIIKIIKVIRTPIVALLLFFCFLQEITDLLWDFNKKWMADCDETIGGVLIITCSLLLTWHLWEKWRYTRLSVCHMAWVLTGIVVYVYLRALDNTFYFWGFNIVDLHIAYTDFVVVPLCLMAWLQYKVYKDEYDKSINAVCMLDKDEPIDNLDDDLLGYNTIINDLLADLRLMDLSKGSYSIGIAGEWGIGKSSFFNLFKKILAEKERRTIIVEFNPRSSSDIKEIQQDFFNSFASALAPFHSGIRRDMLRYQEALQLPEENFIVRLLRLLPSMAVGDSRSAINKIIEAIGRRIFVFVDDFDRLTAKEILEVMKVIDRNGDFRHTVFITAYDKEYVNNVLENYLKHSKNDPFTDKYFDYEYALPTQSQKVLSDYVKDALITRLDDAPGNAINTLQMREEWERLSIDIVKNLRTLRHVKRFMNIFLNRYSRVRNDVNFADFVRVSLLRYYDINVYHALVDGRLTKGGGLLSSTSESLLFRADDIDEMLKEIAKWTGTRDVVYSLLPEGKEGDFELRSKYKRLQFAKSFPIYFFDYQPSGVYHKQLIGLFDANSEEKAWQYLLELIKFDEESRNFDMASYTAVENFLRVRPLSELRNEDDIIRLVELLCCINEFLGRSANIETSLVYLLRRDSLKELSQEDTIQNENSYINRMHDMIWALIDKHPRGMAWVFLSITEDLLKPEIIENEYIFSQEEIRLFAEWTQKSYMVKLERISKQNIDNILALSKVYELVDGKIVISKAAKDEFISYISQQADDFVKSVVKVIKTRSATPKLHIQIIKGFEPDDFFPHNGVTFSYWVRDEVTSLYPAYVLSTLIKADNCSIIINLEPEDYNIVESDFEHIYKVVKKDNDQKMKQKY